MAGWVETLGELGAAWMLWAGSFLRDAEQLPYRAAVIAIMVGAVLCSFAGREWFTEEGEDGEAEEPGNG